ncbi:MAG: MBOAT family protein [Eubacterium sp.]|nr:MBOAT family protein [Eubacterium sp.]
MVFSSLVFLYIFLPAVLLLYYIIPRKGKNFILLIFSLFFYAWGEPVYVLGILASVIVNYLFGIALEKHKSKVLLTVNIILNLGYLAVFKYTGFAIGTLNKLFGLDMEILQIALPIGISFYTFQALSYTIDVYRRTVPAGKNIIDFGTYITMFPQLIAGPIVRYKTVERELRTRKETLADFTDGIVRFASGLGKKVLLANSIGQIWDAVRKGSESDMTTATVWLGMLCFTFQIYFDFSGYSDMAIGLGRMFGFHFDENFNYPYISKSITDFWRRWHISLSTWFKEYVYIPLGGNRKGTGRQLRNIFIVWMLTGLWHGAAWNFVVWGLYYGILLIIEKVWFHKVLEKIPRIFGHIYTLIIVIGGWGIFGFADVLPELKMGFIKGAFFCGNQGICDAHTMYLLSGNIVLLVVAAIISTGVITKFVKKFIVKHEAVYAIGSMVYVAAMFFASTACIVADTYNPFLYFRF